MGWWERAKQGVRTGFEHLLGGIDRFNEFVYPWTGEAGELKYLRDQASLRNYEAMMPRQTVSINPLSRDATRLRPSIIEHYAAPGALTPDELELIGPQNIINIRQASRELYPLSFAQREADWEATARAQPRVRPLQSVPVTTTLFVDLDSTNVPGSPAGGWGQGPSGVYRDVLGGGLFQGMTVLRPTRDMTEEYNRAAAADLAHKTGALTSVLVRLDNLSDRIEASAAAQNEEIAAAFNNQQAVKMGVMRPVRAVPAATTTPSGAVKVAGPVGRPPLPPEELAKRQAAQREEKNRKRREERAARRAASEDTGGL